MISNKNKTLSLQLLLLLTIPTESNHQKLPGIIYILQWTSHLHEPFIYWKRGRQSFTIMNCEYQNCFITHRAKYFDDLTDFDVILFNSIDLDVEDTNLPPIRSDNQIYIFVSSESSSNRPKPEDFNWFFNYTFTYKLDSDIPYPYVYVRNNHGDIVAPKEEVHWMDVRDMKPIDESIKKKLQTKKVAAAWFVTNCWPNSHRLEYVLNLRDALAEYHLSVDIYGRCYAEKDCPKDQMDECLAKIQSDYYFYLAFENSFSVDYVSEKILTALDHYAVLVVMGGANYTRFLPDGTYLNANQLSEEDMARTMNDLIKNKEKYYEYFKWQNHYSYQGVGESADTEPLCAFCAFLNDQTKRSERRTIASFSQWWNLSEASNVVVLGHAEPNVKAYYSYWSKKEKPTTQRTVLHNIQDFFGSIAAYYGD